MGRNPDRSRKERVIWRIRRYISRFRAAVRGSNGFEGGVDPVVDRSAVRIDLRIVESKSADRADASVESRFWKI